MVGNSTLFFCYSTLDSANDLYTNEDLIEPEGLYTKELDLIFEGMYFSPSKSVIRKILERI